MSRWKSWLGVGLVFVCGVVCGVVLTTGIVRYKQKQYAEEPGRMAEAITRKLRWELKLDEAQQTAVRATMQTAARQVREVRAQVDPRFAQILAEAERAVRAVLKGEQIEKFDKILERERAKRAPQATPLPTPAPASS